MFFFYLLLTSFLAFPTQKTTKKSQQKNCNCAAILQDAYPNAFKSITNNEIVWHDGTRMILDDGKQKDVKTLLENADIEDQICAMRYPSGEPSNAPQKYEDAGRVRYEPFFLKMYGNSPQAVQANLVEISWLPKHLNQKIKVSKINGVAEKLQQISNELDTHNEWVKYLKNPGGTFNWRKISGTNRLSMHSFGVTIDINIEFSNYWQWDNKNWKIKGEDSDLNYKNRIPWGIVEIFEKHGFIWGGKWYHYDTMHFEYRPELLIKY